MKFEHVFGPVVSRRLGISLGVDVVRYKYCSLNCVYCEVSKSTHLTVSRKAYYSAAEITAELDRVLKPQPNIDYITFSGAGEPTLNSELGKIIRHIRSKHPSYKLALITNSTLLVSPDVRREIMPCDLILPSLDAASRDCFEKINRPADGLKAEDVIEGLIALRTEFKSQIWLEIFIVPGLNDTPEEMELLKKASVRIKPDVVQLNSLERPGTEAWVEPASRLNMEEIKAILQNGSGLQVEIISKIHPESLITETEGLVLDKMAVLLKKEASSKEMLAKILQTHVNEISKLLRHLAAQGKITAEQKPEGIFYLWKN